jgi:5-methylcytosine-specific restriction protein A
VPSYPCRVPLCTSYVAARGDYCAEHVGQRQHARRERDRFYDAHRRDPGAKQFYDSAAWQRARATKLAAAPVCERCQREWARHVHHVRKVRDCTTTAERTDQANLKSLCPPCHNAEEADDAAAAAAASKGAPC